ISPGAARPGGLVCRILKLKKITNAKSAGGCGVVQFPSGLALFRVRVAALAYTGGLIVLRGFKVLNGKLHGAACG
ncbi:hypothetical protein J1785_07275, partial [Rahnella sp. SL6]|uniref:hypothetical protein n=1 Tax=Rahnella perminowiae TaxID=2816244 RepID=UPI001C2661D0